MHETTYEKDNPVNGGVLLLLAGLFSLLFFLVQRTELRRRRIATLVVVVVGLLTLYWANFRDLGREFVYSLLAALILNFLFWLLVGRYNPVGDSDESIQVIGMDD
ncbi:MAG: hypothetical protein K8J31_01815 [Anaerolineae bacterium]|nr:hypothetical protein [Anaerolineae bacterium]